MNKPSNAENDTGDGSNDIPTNIPILESTPIREDLVATAVKFLQNPKVLSSPLQQKKNFMKKKGLTDEEIARAVELSGAANNNAFSQPAQSANQALPAISTLQPHQPVSGWIRLRDYSSMAILFAGVLYGIYTFYKKYIEPIFLRRYKQQEEKLDKMEKEIIELNSGVTKNLQELQTSISALREQLADQSIKLATVSSNFLDYKDSAGSGGSSSTISAIQSELTSVKALLLGTKQFPSTPAVQPVIPSWQMKPKAVLGGDAGRVSGQSSVHSLDSTDSQRSSSFASPAFAKTVSKSDLEQDSGDEASNPTDDLTRENTVNGDFDSQSTSPPESYVHLNGNAAENSNESEMHVDSKKLPNNSSLQAPVEFSPEPGKTIGESELD